MSKSAGFFLVYFWEKALIVSRLVLVHPFRDSRLRQPGNVLESWAREANNKFGDLFNIRVFSFDIYDVFEYGPQRLERTSQTLQYNIQRLRENNNSPLYSRSGDEPSPKSSGRAGFEQKPSSFIFVAHSLGAWVVKSLGSLPEMLGCIFVDARVSPSTGDYDQYTFDLAKLVALKSGKEVLLKSISEYLKQIDNSVSANRVQHPAKTSSRGNLSQVLEGETVPFAIWMSPESGAPPLKVSRLPGLEKSF